MPADKDELPLYQLYAAVKKLDAATGHATVDSQSYLTLLQTIRNGYMVSSPEALLLLCEKLWIKPYHRSSGILNREVLQELLLKYIGVQVTERTEGNAATTDTGQPAPPPPSRPRTRTPPPPSPVAVAPPPPSAMDRQLLSEPGSLNVSVKDMPDDGSGTGSNPPAEDPRFTANHFLVRGNYMPINLRNIEQSVRLYRQRLKDVQQWVDDWPATVREISRKGFFEQIAQQEMPVYASNFALLIDSSPSMAAFEDYSEAIADAVARRNSRDYEDIYYFQNVPGNLLYFDRLQSATTSFRKFVSTGRKSILVISDAGAARGHYNEDRIRATYGMLRSLARHRVAWLNPMPRERWRKTSAAIIARYTDMFDIGEGAIDSLGNMVRLFKSKIQTAKI